MHIMEVLEIAFRSGGHVQNSAVQVRLLSLLLSLLFSLLSLLCVSAVEVSTRYFFGAFFICGWHRSRPQCLGPVTP